MKNHSGFYSRVKKYLRSKGVISTSSYSQSGEDVIVRFIFDHLGISRPTYIDLGAHDPAYLSNTKIFYDEGSRGINVEPDCSLFVKFKSRRKQDINLNVGVCREGMDGEADFYVMSIPTMNTFSIKEAERLDMDTSIKISEVVKVPVLSLSKILAINHLHVFPDYLTIDIEGLDEVVIETLNAYAMEARPKVMCVETIQYAETSVPQKRETFITKIKQLGYLVYADTWINTIFVRDDLFRRSFLCAHKK